MDNNKNGSEVDHFLFDLDGTITTEELLPKIAREIGVQNEIEELTRLTIAGTIPFEYSLRHRVEILNIARVSLIQEIVADVDLDPFIFEFICNNSSRCTVVTGNLDAWLQKLNLKLGIPVLSSRVEVQDDRIVKIAEVMDKGTAVRSFGGRICAIGDGHNDIDMLDYADVGIAYGGVHAPARSLYEVASHAIFDGDTLCRFLSRL